MAAVSVSGTPASTMASMKAVAQSAQEMKMKLR